MLRFMNFYLNDILYIFIKKLFIKILFILNTKILIETLYKYLRINIKY